MTGISEEERARRDMLIAEAQRSGRMMKDVAAELGISERGLRHYRALRRDPAIEDAKTAVNTQLEPALVWATGVDKRPSGFAVYGQANKKRYYLGMRKCHTAAMFLKLRFDIEHGFSSRHGQRAS